MAEQQDLYKVLGLRGGLDGGAYATPAEVRKAYRSKSLLCHPDKRPEDPLAASAEFKVLQQAYTVLSDERKRKEYDDRLHKNTLHSAVTPAPKRRKKAHVSNLFTVPKGNKNRVFAEEMAKARAMGAGVGEAGERTISVNWDCPAGYDEVKLREIFGLFGPIEKVVAPKRCRKGAGVVLFRFRASATGAVAGLADDPDLKLQMGQVKLPGSKY